MKDDISTDTLYTVAVQMLTTITDAVDKTGITNTVTVVYAMDALILKYLLQAYGRKQAQGFIDVKFKDLSKALAKMEVKDEDRK